MKGKEKLAALRFNLQMLIGLVVCLWIVMGSFPISWIYDLGVGTGTEQGQWPDGNVIPLQEQDEVEHFFLQRTPVTVTGRNLIHCPLGRLRDLKNEGEHYYRRNGVTRTVYTSEYCALPYPANLFYTMDRLFLTGAFYNSYHLIELKDGSYICGYFDDYLLYKNLLNGEIDCPTGYIRYTTTEERRMLNQMTEDYDVNPVYILDMYRYNKASWMIDLSLRLGLVLIIMVAFLTIKELVTHRLAKFLEVQRYG